MRGDGEQQRVYRWYCLTCAYTHPIEGVVRVDVDLTPKDVDDVLGGEGAWKYAAVEKAVSCERDGCESTSTYAEFTVDSSLTIVGLSDVAFSLTSLT